MVVSLVHFIVVYAYLFIKTEEVDTTSLQDFATSCNYGTAPVCHFPCNCEDTHEVCDPRTGSCASGCRDGYPIGQGFRWSGPGCRIGNVALNKTATSSNMLELDTTRNDPTKAVDGKTPPSLTENDPTIAVDGIINPSLTHNDPKNTVDGTTPPSLTPNDPRNTVDGIVNPPLASGSSSSCFVCGSGSTNNNSSCWWKVDLDTEHIIFNITICNSLDNVNGDYEKLQDMAVYVSGITTHQPTFCGLLTAVHNGQSTVQCMEEPVGKYVFLTSSGKSDEGASVFALCEVVVIGTAPTDEMNIPELERNQEMSKRERRALPIGEVECKAGNNPCVNGDCSMKPSTSEITCTCKDGYTGMYCDSDIDECSSNPCVNGTCGNRIGAFTCKCFGIYKGLFCDQLWVYTSVSIGTGEMFSMNHTDMEEKDSKQMVMELEQELVDLLEKQIIHFQQLEVVLFRKNSNGKLIADIKVITLSRRESFYVNLLQQHIQTTCENLFVINTELNYELLEVGLPQLGVDIPQLQYVFTRASFNLNEKYKRAYLDMEGVERSTVVTNIETTLNEYMAIVAKEFQFLVVRTLRKVDVDTFLRIVHTGVDVIILSLAPVDHYDPTTVMSTMKAALLKVLSVGTLGPYKMALSIWEEIVEVDVQRPILGPYSSIRNYVYVLTRVLFRIEVPFELNFAVVQSGYATKITDYLIEEFGRYLRNKIRRFEHVQVLLLKPVGYAEATFVEVEVVSTAWERAINTAAVMMRVKAAVDRLVKDRQFEKLFNADGHDVVSIFTPVAGVVPPMKEYAIAVVSITLQEDFIMLYTYPLSEETKNVMAMVQLDLDPLVFFETFTFANVTLLREENGDTVVDMTVAYLFLHDAVFNENSARKHVEQVMQKLVEDGDVGGYGVVPASALNVKTPQLSVIPPDKVYSYTPVGLWIEHPWKNMFYNMRHSETKRLAMAVEQELNIVFDDSGGNQNMEITGLGSKQGKVMINFYVATLETFGEFHSTVTMAINLGVMEKVVEDGDVAGYKVNPSAAVSVEMHTATLEYGIVEAEKLRVLKDEKKYIEQKGRPKSPQTVLIGVIIAVFASVAIVVAVVISVVSRKRKNYKAGKKVKHLSSDAASSSSTIVATLTMVGS